MKANIYRTAQKYSIQSNQLIILLVIDANNNKGFTATEIVKLSSLSENYFYMIFRGIKDNFLVKKDKKYYLSKKAIQAIKEYKLALKRDLKAFNK